MNHVPLGSNVLAAFTPGKAALDLADDSDEELVAKALSVLEIAYG